MAGTTWRHVEEEEMRRSLEAKKSSLWNSRSPWSDAEESMSLTATGFPAREPEKTGPKPPWPRVAEKLLVARRRRV